MIVSHSKQSSRKSKQTLQSTKPQANTQLSPLRQRMSRDMELAGNSILFLPDPRRGLVAVPT